MTALLQVGVVMTVAGLSGVIASGVLVARARRDFAEDEDALKARLARLLPMNLVAFGVAVLGLMTIAVGGLLG